MVGLLVVDGGIGWRWLHCLVVVGTAWREGKNLGERERWEEMKIWREKQAVTVMIFLLKLVNPTWVNQQNRGLWMQPTATILKISNFLKSEGI